MIFQVGDEIIHVDGSYRATVLEVEEHRYIIKITQSPKNLATGFNFQLSSDTVNKQYRKLTKLDKALK